SPEACTVEPITWQEIESVAATQTAGSSSPRQSFAIDPALRLELKPRREAGLLQVTGGDPADPATIADIQEVLNEFVACQNAGGFPRWLALFSEEIIGAIGSLSGEGADFYRAELQATPTTRPREQWIGYYPIAEARTFYSGHVVVIQPADINWLRLPNETIEPDPDDPYLLVSFAQEGDRWVIDGFQIVEARDLLEQPSSFPNATVEATVATTPEFTPTHRSNAHMQVNLRSGPSTDSRIVTTLSIAQPLHYLEEDAPTEDPARDGPRWMKFRTENGDIGWVREIDVEPINAPTPTPIG
ncbi:MAG: SH3 domain-containing protein, partial [Thermomicrobiales bacterium]